MRIDLTSGEQTALSQPGVYRPGDLPRPYSFDQPLAEWTPALSPDFRFLALPDPAGSGTWLVDLTGAEQARKLLDSPAPVSWSPDGATIAWIDGDHLSVRDISGGAPRVLATIEGLLNVAWSPKGAAIAAASRGSTDAQITISLVDARSGAVQVLTRARPVAAVGSGFDLAWTLDGSEVWYSPAMVAYALEERAPRTLLSPYLFAGERQTMYALSAAPDPQGLDQQSFAGPSNHPEQANHVLDISASMFVNSGRYEIFFDQPWQAYAWTEEGKILIVQEGSGSHARLWRIQPDIDLPVYSVHPEDMGMVLGPGFLIGTRSHLMQYHRQLAPRAELRPVLPPAPEYADQWDRIEMQEARMRIECPAYWNYQWPGGGDVASSLANFDLFSGYLLASLSPSQFYAHFDSFFPLQGDAQAFLKEAVLAPQANATWQEMIIDGRTGYRVRWNDMPTYEEVLVPFDDQMIVRIRKYPLRSDHDDDFERMLRTAQWLPPELWSLRAYPTPTMDPTRHAAPGLNKVSELPALHWREGFSFVAVTSRGEIARSSNTRLTFYDPATMEVTRTGLVTLAANSAVTALNAEGTRLARAIGSGIEILDLTGLNEQADPPVLATLRAAGHEVARLAYSPDGKMLAVVSQEVRDDIGPAFLEVYDTQRLHPFGSWNVLNPPDLAFSPDSRWLAGWIRAGKAPIAYYNLDPAAESALSFSIQRQEVWESASFSADSQVLAAASEGGGIFFWNLPDGAYAGNWTISQGSFISDLAVAPGNRCLAIATPDGLELRRMGDGSLAGFVNRQMYWVEFVEQGEDLFLVGMDGNGVVDAWRIDAR